MQASHDWFWICLLLAEEVARVFTNQSQHIEKVKPEQTSNYFRHSIENRSNLNCVTKVRFYLLVIISDVNNASAWHELMSYHLKIRRDIFSNVLFNPSFFSFLFDDSLHCGF